MKWAIYASGFREERGKHTGTKTNAHQVEMLHQTGECRVRYVEWNDDPEGYARSIADQWTLGDTIILTGYSWGAGNWVKKFLWTLYGINPRGHGCAGWLSPLGEPYSYRPTLELSRASNNGSMSPTAPRFESITRPMSLSGSLSFPTLTPRSTTPPRLQQRSSTPLTVTYNTPNYA